MSWQIVRLDDVSPQPWRNGGGVTRELLAWPTVNDWVVRISVADITRDGPFSAFSGVDRWFAVLQGEGVRLGDPPTCVTNESEPTRFAGELAPSCALISGPTRDLNLMIARRRASGRMCRAQGVLRIPAGMNRKRFLVGLFATEACSLEIDGTPLIEVPEMALVWRTYSTQEHRPSSEVRLVTGALAFSMICEIEANE